MTWSIHPPQNEGTILSEHLSASALPSQASSESSLQDSVISWLSNIEDLRPPRSLKRKRSTSSLPIISKPLLADEGSVSDVMVSRDVVKRSSTATNTFTSLHQAHLPQPSPLIPLRRPPMPDHNDPPPSPVPQTTLGFGIVSTPMVSNTTSKMHWFDVPKSRKGWKIY